jgi:hypothetical protein
LGIVTSTALAGEILRGRDTGRLEWARGFKIVKDFLVVITFLAMVLMPAFAALNVFSPKKNRF